MSLSDPQLLGVLADAAPDALLVIATNGRIRYANRATLTMFGYADGELLGQTIETLIPTRYRSRHRSDRRRYEASPRSRPMGHNTELVGRRQDGSEIPVEVSLSPLTAEGERLVVAAVRDVSELRRSRELAKRSQRQLVLARLAEQAVSSAGTASFCTAMLHEVVGQLRLSHACICERGHDGAYSRVIARHGWTDDAAPLQVIERALPRGRAQRLFANDLQQVQVIPGRSGRRNPAGYLCGSLMPLRGPAGVHGLVAMFRSADAPLSVDECLFAQSACHLGAAVFERLLHEALLLQASKMEALGQLTGGIAHDFNNLLTVIAGNLQILEDLLGAGTDERALVDAATRAARRGAELTAKLLAFSRKSPLAAQALDCAQLLNGMRDLLRRTLGEGIELRYCIEADLGRALADAGQLESAILNLALNARDAMPRGGTLTLSAHYRREHDSAQSHECIVIEVSDDGEGMSPEVQAHAFEPFFTTKATGKGTGLGLSMVYGFVRQWGGDVRIYSEIGHGTTVRLLLPLAQEHTSPPSAATPHRRLAGHEHLLVVEDDPEVSRIAQAQLRSLGYRVSAVERIADALAALDAHTDIRLLFTDVVLLAGETGFQLADLVRARWPELPVLYCSGYAEAALESHFGIRERPRILAKPYTREELATAVRELLDQRRADRAPAGTGAAQNVRSSPSQ